MRLNIGALIIILLLHINTAFAASFDTDSSPTPAEVQTLINNASSGDTIVFQGDATWASGITVDKALTLNGNGHTLTAGGSLTNAFIKISNFTANTNPPMRVTRFTFITASDNTNPTSIAVMGMTGEWTDGNIRIDNNVFHYGSNVIYFHHPKGLIDNNTFYNGQQTIEFYAGSAAYQEKSWESMAAGTASALFIEDNVFINDGDFTGATQEQIGTNQGGKLVVRYNEFDGDDLAHDQIFTPFMTHGGGGGYWQIDSVNNNRGQSVVEIYENTMHGYRIDWMFILRGSANLIWNNDFTGTSLYTPGLLLREEEFEDYGGGQSSWNPARTAWPAEDQVHNTFLWGNTYNGAAHFTDCSAIMVSINNSTCTGNGTPISCCTDKLTGTCGPVTPDATSPFIQLNRDFFLHAPCGASDSVDAYGNTCTHGKASFTGANGASGSYPTNGSTYPTQGTMIFTETGDNAYYGYTPYTYPHPLRGLGKHISGGTVSGGIF